MAIDATVSGTSSNSYHTVATAQAYFDTRLHCDDWTNATALDKEKALLQACRIIDSYCLWLGIKTVTEQALEWPRRGICHDGNIYYEYNDSIYEYGSFGEGQWVLASDAIPQQILDGQCELALVLLGDDTQSDALLDSLNIAGIKIDLSSKSKGNVIIPSAVWSIMAPLGKLRGASGTVKLLRC